MRKATFIGFDDLEPIHIDPRNILAVWWNVDAVVISTPGHDHYITGDLSQAHAEINNALAGRPCQTRSPFAEVSA